ncbi:MAG: threonine aldolase [Kiritimatiellia bacterium]|jgi:threonine aldolase
MKNQPIDLRSDTITQPTPAMRQAMAEAEVGDDVFGDDPTVNQLEQATAELLGKEAAVFVPSGTMANQIAIRCHTRPGDEMLLDGNAHIYWYEGGGPAALSGVSSRLLPGDRGIFTVEDMRAAMRPVNDHYPTTRLLAVEQTHNRGGGTIWPLEDIEAVCHTAHEAGMQTHLDGARLWNACAATGIAESTYAKSFDSLSICFSKGLGAPAGSILAGNREFITQARRYRKLFGGGMRQVGILAAAAMHALTHHRERLVDDHTNARRLADGLSELPSLCLDIDRIETNMVYFDVEGMPAAELVEQLKSKGVLMLDTDEQTIRAVTSLAVNSDDIEKTIDAMKALLPG